MGFGFLNQPPPSHDIKLCWVKPQGAIETGTLVAYFINSQLTLLLVIALALFSIGTVILVPKEENPQINVPGAAVTFSYPGAPAEVVEKSVTTIIESRIRELQGIDHIYSTSVNSGSEIDILLTSMAAILGNAPILLDPIWAGLGWTIITGMMASSALTLVVIPLIYYGDHLQHAKYASELEDSNQPQDNTRGEQSYC